MQKIEHMSFNAGSLLLFLREDALEDVHIAHSMKVYKGKVFLLVRYFCNGMLPMFLHCCRVGKN